MCTSKPEGGQRCFSDTKEALDNAHAKKVKSETLYQFAVESNASASARESLLRKGMAAEHAYEDALAQYASTEKGRADLTERLKTAPVYHKRQDPTGPNRPDDHATLSAAISDGDYLAHRAAETKRAVRAGEMSPETALQRTEYPNEFALAHRQTRTDAAVARIMATSAVGPDLAEGHTVSNTYTSRRPAIGEVITFVRWDASTQRQEPVTGTVTMHTNMDSAVITVLADGPDAVFDYIDGDTEYAVLPRS